LPSLEILLPWLAILLISLSFHEAAHAFTADRLGDPTARQLGRLTLNPISHIDPIGTLLFPLIAIMTGFPVLGWAKPVPVNWGNLRSPRRDFAVVALAGPVSNVVLAVGVAIVLLTLRASGAISLSVDDWLIQTVSLNMLLAAFNLIPVPPLDGGNVLAGLVPESLARVIDHLRPWGFVIIYVLLFTGVVWRIVRPAQDLVFRVLL
jgi:Zn-dependent protease